MSGSIRVPDGQGGWTTLAELESRMRGEEPGPSEPQVANTNASMPPQPTSSDGVRVPDGQGGYTTLAELESVMNSGTDAQNTDETDTDRNILQVAGDTTVALAESVPRLAQGVAKGSRWAHEVMPSLSDLPVVGEYLPDNKQSLVYKLMGGVDKHAGTIGDKINTFKSDELKNKRAIQAEEWAEADGFIESAKVIGSNPSVLADDIFTQGAELVSTGFVGKILGGVKALGKVVAASGFGGVLEAGRMNDTVKEQLNALSDEQWADNDDFIEAFNETGSVAQAREQVSEDYANRVGGVAAIAITLTGSVPLLNSMNRALTGVAAEEIVEQGMDGIIMGSVRRAIANRTGAEVGEQTTDGFIRGVVDQGVDGAVGEGLQETVSGGATDIAENLAMGAVDDETNWNDDLGKSAGANLVAGSAMGLSVGGATGGAAGWRDKKNKEMAAQHEQRIERERLDAEAQLRAAQEQRDNDQVEQAQREQQVADDYDQGVANEQLNQDRQRSAMDEVVTNLEQSEFERVRDIETEAETRYRDTEQTINDEITAARAELEHRRELAEGFRDDEVEQKFEQRYGEPRIKPLDENAGIEAQRFRKQEIAKQYARLGQETGEAPADYLTRIDNRQEPIGTEGDNKRVADKQQRVVESLEKRLAEHQETMPEHLRQDNRDPDDIESDNFSRQLELESEIDYDSLLDYNEPDPNSATAESQAIPLEQTVNRSIDTNENIQSTIGRDATEVTQRQDSDIGQQENNSEPGRGSETIADQRNDERQVSENSTAPDIELEQPTTVERSDTQGRGQRIANRQRTGTAASVERARLNQAKRTVDRIKQQSNGRVESFGSPDSLAPSVRAAYQQALNESATGEAPVAFFDNETGRIHIDETRLTSERDVQLAITHESTHAGLRDLYGYNENAIRDAMLDLVRQANTPLFAEQMSAKYNVPIDKYIGGIENPDMNDLAMLMEEVLAYGAEHESSRNAVTKLVNHIRDFLARMGITVPYREGTTGEQAVIDLMRKAQRAYARSTKADTWRPTQRQVLDNAIPDVIQNQIRTRIVARHEQNAEHQRANPNQLPNVIHGNRASAEPRERSERRLSYRLTPGSMYSRFQNSTARTKIGEWVRMNIVPSQISSAAVANMKQMADAQIAADTVRTNYVVTQFNTAMDTLGLTKAEETAMFEAVQSHITGEPNTTLPSALRASAQSIRSAEIRLDVAEHAINTGDYSKIPDELHAAFDAIRGSDSSATPSASFVKHGSKERNIAQAFVTGKVDPSIPKSMHGAITAMRVNVDALSGAVLNTVEIQIEDRIARLSDQQYADYKDFEGLREFSSWADMTETEVFKGVWAEDGSIPHSLITLLNLRDTISGNLGTYLHRSYKAHVDPDHTKTTLENTELVDRAVEYFKKEKSFTFWNKLSEDKTTELEEWLDDYPRSTLTRQRQLIDGEATGPWDYYNQEGEPAPHGYGDFLESITRKRIVVDEIETRLNEAHANAGTSNDQSNGAMYGSMNLSVLARRENISPIMRELLGEYRDPRINYVRSAAKMTNLVAKQEFLNGMAQELTGTLLFYPGTQPDTGFGTKLQSGQSDSMNPIAGMYTNAELKELLQQWAEVKDVPKWLSNYMMINGAVKIGKTVYNTGTHAANAGSAVLLTMLNGHLRPSTARHAFRLYAADMLPEGVVRRVLMGDKYTLEELQAETVELTERGILQDGVNAGEIRAMLNDAARSNQSVLDYLQRNQLGALSVKYLGKADEVIKKQYQWEDDLFKIMGYLHEVKHNKDVRGLDDETARVEASIRIRDTYPTYSMVPEAIQELRRFPVVGSFVSYSSEMLRTTYNQKKYMQQDWQNDRGKATNRIFWGTMGFFGTNIAAALSRTAHGIDDEDDELYRKLLPPWSEFGTIMYMGTDKNGNMEYVDLARFDPWSHFKRMANAVDDNYQAGTYTKLKELATQTLAPFFGTEILAGVLGDIAYNSKYGLPGLQIANPEDTSWDRNMDYLSYAWRGLSPGFAASATRIKLAIDGEVSQGGKQYLIKDEVYGLMGFRKGTINVEVAATRQASIASRGVGFSQDIINDVLSDQAMYDDKEIAREYKKMIKARTRNYRQAISMIEGFRQQGLSDATILSNMVDGGMSKKNTKMLIQGIIPEYKLSDRVASSALNRALKTARGDVALQNKLKMQFKYKQDQVRKLAGQGSVSSSGGASRSSSRSSTRESTRESTR